jgi:hypothetical protein
MEKSYEELQMIMRESSGTTRYHRITLVKNFLVTDGVKYFAKEANAYWLTDIVASYIRVMEKTDDYFFVPVLTVDKKQNGRFKIYREVSGNKKVIVRQNIEYADLPTGEYKFFLFREDEFFIMICPSEY